MRQIPEIGEIVRRYDGDDNHVVKGYKVIETGELYVVLGNDDGKVEWYLFGPEDLTVSVCPECKRPLERRNND